MGGLFLLFLHLCPGAVFGASERWDLKAVFDSALTKTETVASRSAATEQAREREWQATGKILPSVNLIGSYLRQDPGPGSSNAFTRGEQSNARINLVQPIFHGFGEFAERRSRLALVRSQEKQLEQSKLTLFQQVAQSYYSTLACEQDLKLLTHLKDLTEKRLVDLHNQVRIGKSRAADRLAAEAQAATLDAQIAAAETTRNQAWETFRFVTGIQTMVPLQEPNTEIPDKTKGLEDWLGKIAARPDLQIGQALVESSDEQITVARIGHFPAIDLNANYYLKRAGVLADSKWDASLSLTIPIFQGGAVQAQVREANEKKKEQELLLATTRRNAEKEIRSLHQEVSGHLRQHIALKKAVDLAEKNYEQQNKDFRFGLTTHLDVLQAMNTLEEAHRLYDKNRYQAYAALASLKAAVGESL